MSDCAEMEMPKYQCHKKVWALKIKNLEPKENGSAVLTPEEAMYGPFVLDKEYVNKHNPQIGGYYVVYEGNYKSFSPAEAFEAGYTKI